MNLNMEVNN